MHESLSWRFVCLFLNCGDGEEVSEKCIMAADLVESIEIANSLATGVD